MWVTPRDRDTFRDATGENPSPPGPGSVDDDEPAAPELLALNRNCTYTSAEREKKKRGSIPRDTGASVSTGITVQHATEPVTPGVQPSTFPAHVQALHRAAMGQQLIPPQRVSAAAAAPQNPIPAATPMRLAPVPRLRPTATPQDRRALAARLECNPEQVGSCASCHAPTVRYGNGGNPLCRPCKEQRPASR